MATAHLVRGHRPPPGLCALGDALPSWAWHGPGGVHDHGAHLGAVLEVGQRLEPLAIAGWITVLSACLQRSGRVPPSPAPGDEDTQ